MLARPAMSPLVLPGVRAFTAGLLAALLFGNPLLAQAPPAAATPAPTPRPGVTAAEEVTVLTLDVVAVDGKNRPVFGLVAADFEIRVAGKVQTIDFFEPPREPRSPAGAKEGRPDSEERIAGTTTPFETKGTARHVLVWVDLEQLPRRSILDTATALHKSFDHAPAGRYGFATHFGGVSSRVWDADSVESLLVEADRMTAEVAEDRGGAAMRSPGVRGVASQYGMDSPLQYEARRMYEDQLIRDLIAAENASGDTRLIIQAISQYLVRRAAAREDGGRGPPGDGGALRRPRGAAPPLLRLGGLRERPGIQLPRAPQGRGERQREARDLRGGRLRSVVRTPSLARAFGARELPDRFRARRARPRSSARAGSRSIPARCSRRTSSRAGSRRPA